MDFKVIVDGDNHLSLEGITVEIQEDFSNQVAGTSLGINNLVTILVPHRASHQDKDQPVYTQESIASEILRDRQKSSLSMEINNDRKRPLMKFECLII